MQTSEISTRPVMGWVEASDAAGKSGGWVGYVSEDNGCHNARRICGRVRLHVSQYPDTSESVPGQWHWRADCGGATASGICATEEQALRFAEAMMASVVAMSEQIAALRAVL